MSRPKRSDGRNANTVAKNKYNADKFDRLSVLIGKSSLLAIKEEAKKQGKSVTALINDILADNIPKFVKR